MISINKIIKAITFSSIEAPKPVEPPKQPDPPKTRIDLKVYLKSLVVQIKTHKSYCRQNGSNCSGEQYELRSLKSQFRIRHIAYCELRGRSRDQIEKPGKDHLPDEKKIQEIKEMYGTPIHPGT
jgi:hypothetical protein